jgi:hypothetical protein
MARKVEEMGDKTDEKQADKVGCKNPQKGLDTKKCSPLHREKHSISIGISFF